MPLRLAARSFLLGTFCAAWSSLALAQTPDAAGAEPAAERLPATRSEVVLGVTGTLDAEARVALARLLRAELAPHGLSLVELDPSGEVGSWAREVVRRERSLLAVLVDAKNPARWRLVLIDTARGRAISRELPGGERDAANVEAIVSIVLTATNALREGLEVASAPLEAVVEPTRKPVPVPPRPAPPPPPPPAERTRGTSLHGSVSAIGASFSEAAEPTFGGALALGVSIGSLVDVDLGAARYFPAKVENDVGSFSLERTSLSLSAGPVFRSGAFVFVPVLGASVEWIARTDTRAAPGVASGEEESTVQRFGAMLALRGRFRVLSRGDDELLSVVGAVGASYFGQRVRFLAASETLAEVRRPSFGGELGLFVATGSL